MKVLLEIDRPVPGRRYMGKVKNKKLIFQLMEIEDATEQIAENEDFPEFGSMPWFKGFNEKEMEKAKKTIVKELKP